MRVNNMYHIETINLVEVEGEGLYTFAAYCHMYSSDYRDTVNVLICDANVEYVDLNDDGELFIVNCIDEDIAI